MSPRLARRLSSLRTKFLLITLLGAVVPMGLVGYWVTTATKNSGADFLRDRLDSTLTNVAVQVGNRWVAQRSALLSLADDSLVRNALGARGTPRVVRLTRLHDVYGTIRGTMQLVLVRDVKQRALFLVAADTAGDPELVPAAESLRVAGPRLGDVVTVTFSILSQSADTAIGAVEGRLRATAMLPVGLGSAAGAGAVIAMVDRQSGTAVVPLPFDARLLARGRFQWEGRLWLAASRSLDEPPVDLFAAAPLDTFVGPFERVASRGLLALLLVAVAVIALAIALARRVTRSLEELATAAEAVSGGNLEQRVETRGSDEVTRVARAFNAMTENLRTTLRELSQRQAVAAVGEFAAALAHEVRNPLSAMKLNLQHAEEKAKDHRELRELLGNAIRDIERLDRTVAAALRIARSGRAPLEAVDLWPIIDASARISMPEFTSRGASLEIPPAGARRPVHVKGDAGALEQLFLNLLLNAAQALNGDGLAGVSVELAGDRAAITVWDNGRGITDVDRGRVFDAFFSTKPEGTGMGLPVAKRIALAHGGGIEVESTPGRGTRVRTTLPMLRDHRDALEM